MKFFSPSWHSYIKRLMLLVCLCAAVTAAASCSAPQAVATPTRVASTPTVQGSTPTKPATQTAVPTAEEVVAENIETVRIRSKASGDYLFEASGRVKMGAVEAGDRSAQWVIEDFQGSKRLKNAASGNYIAIEHLLKYVEVLPVEDVWMSPRWSLEPVASEQDGGAVVLRSAWHNWQVLYSDGSEDARYGQVPASGENAQWIIENVEGVALSLEKPGAPVQIPTASVASPVPGAVTPWIEYEAEAGETNGEILQPDRAFGTFASESSGRSSVELDATGEYVQFKTQQAANSIVVRFSIPDSEDGEGQASTLSVYVNGVFARKLTLTSRFAWSYGGQEQALNVPSVGGAHHFFDEARALLDPIPAGAVVRLQKDSDDTAETIRIDLVDLEDVAPAAAKPDGYLDIVSDCGAVADDGKDDGAAIQECIDQAQGQQTGVWIPQGVFESLAEPFTVSDVTIRGAGMWYSTIHGFYARFNCAGNNCRYFDFAVLGETILRDDGSPENAFGGGAGTGSRLENIWVEHTKVGYWVGPGTNGLVILNSRFRNLFADGVNFCNGTSNSVVENSHFRNTGDDALASWSPANEGGVNTNNVFRFNTVQIPWRANCFAIYGGKDNRIEDSLCADPVMYPGILLAQQFNSHPFSGTTILLRSKVVRAGGSMYHQDHGALKIWADQGPISGVMVKDVTIEDATFAGIEIEGSYPITDTVFEYVQIAAPGDWGIQIRSNAVGEVSFDLVTVSDPGTDGLLNYGPAKLFNLIRGAGNSGW